MSRRTLYQKLDDGLSPIVVKELRQAVQSKLVIVVLLTFLLVQVLVLGGFLLFSDARTVKGDLDFGKGRNLFLWLHGFMLGACMLVPVYVGVRLAVERSDTNVDLLFISTLKPWSILHGKFLSGVMLLLIIISACTPFLTFTYLLRGLDVPSILTVIGMDVMFALYGLSMAIFLAVIPAPLVLRFFLGLIGLGQIAGLFAMDMSLAYELVNRGLGMSSRVFWEGALVYLIPMLTTMGLMFTWSLAILSPPSSNRAVPMRLYVLLVTVATGGGAWALSAWMASYLPLAVWLAVVSMLCCTQLFVTVNERDTLGVRVTRTIPRSFLLRLPAFLLYSGSAGGVIFATLLMLGSIAFGLGILSAKGDDVVSPVPIVGRFGASGVGSGWGWVEIMYDFVRFAVVCYLYAYCFCMTAAAIRGTLLRSTMRPGFTWLLVLILVGLGSFGPYLLTFFLRHDDPYARYEDPLLVTNPFASIDHTMSYRDYHGHDPFDMDCLPFLVIWASLATLASLYWMGRQLANFRPAVRTVLPTVEEPAVVILEPEPIPGPFAPETGVTAP